MENNRKSIWTLALNVVTCYPELELVVDGDDERCLCMLNLSGLSVGVLPWDRVPLAHVNVPDHLVSCSVKCTDETKEVASNKDR
jgi:hypothetical protein